MGQPFQLLEKKGEGSYAEVYHALYNDKHVAIKKITDWDGDGLRVYNREVKFLEQLRHDNVVRLIDSFVQHHINCDTAYIVMELGRETIGEYCKKRPCKDYWYRQMAAAVAYCHSVGIAHLDIAYTNFVIFDNRIKLIDFGLSFQGRVYDLCEYDIRYHVQNRPIELCLNFKYFVPGLADVWALGTTMATIYRNMKPLFHLYNSELDRFDVVDMVVNQIGPIPDWMLRRELAKCYDDYDAVKTQHDFPLPDPLEITNHNNANPQLEKIIRWALTIDLDERPTAAQLLAMFDG